MTEIFWRVRTWLYDIYVDILMFQRGDIAPLDEYDNLYYDIDTGEYYGT